MNRSLCLICVICAICASFLSAQDIPEKNRPAGRPAGNPADNQSGEMMQGFRRRPVVLDINAKVLEHEQVVWNETHQKITIPGTPVGIQLVGSNLVLAVQFTPFLRRHGHVLVAQVQIGINDPAAGVNYYTSIQTIPVEFNEPVYFFPLGQSGEASSIEITITINPHRDPEAIGRDE